MDIKWKSAHTTGFSLILEKSPRSLSQSTRTKPPFVPPTTLARSPAAHTNSILLLECASLLPAPVTSALHFLVPSTGASFPRHRWVSGFLLGLSPQLKHRFLTNTLPARLPPCQSLSGSCWSHLHTSSTCPYLSTFSSFARHLSVH